MCSAEQIGHLDVFLEGLTPEHVEILAAVLAHSTMTGAAKALGMGRTTLYSRIKEPELALALREARSQMVHLAVTKLQQSSAIAGAVLVELAQDKTVSAASRIRASELILEFSFRGSELVDIQAELAELRSLYEGTK